MDNNFINQTIPLAGSVYVSDSKEKVSLKIVLNRAKQLAKAIKEFQPTGEAVLLCVSRSNSLPTCIFGIWFAKRGYVPVDERFPRSRCEQIITDSGATLAITDTLDDTIFGEYYEVLTHISLRNIFEDEKTPRISLSPSCDGDVAYTIYTSGTTGKPKGVVLPHKAVNAFCEDLQEHIQVGSSDIWLAFTTISFDISVAELVFPISKGSSVYVGSLNEQTNCGGFHALARENKITIFQATPTYFQMLVSILPNIRFEIQCLCGGEGFPAALAMQLVKHFSCVYNVYGPTETCIWSSIWKVESQMLATTVGMTPIGSALHQEELFHSFESEVFVPSPGKVSELIIGGMGLAVEYKNLPDVTSSKFCSFTSRSNESSRKAVRCYRTGDLGSRLESGLWSCHGRLDNQIKHRGFRIELDDIEAKLSECAAVTKLVALHDKENDHLIAVIVCSSKKLSNSDLLDALNDVARKQLPWYMIPEKYYRFTRLPTLESGKCNRKVTLELCGEMEVIARSFER